MATNLTSLQVKLQHWKLEVQTQGFNPRKGELKSFCKRIWPRNTRAVISTKTLRGLISSVIQRTLAIAMTVGHCLKQLGVWGAVSHIAGPGQSPGRGPGGGAPRSSRDFAISEALK